MLKDDGRKRSSKASKKNNIEKRKLKKIKCLNCKELIEYHEEDLIRIGGIQYVECPMCDMEIIIK